MYRNIYQIKPFSKSCATTSSTVSPRLRYDVSMPQRIWSTILLVGGLLVLIAGCVVVPQLPIARFTAAPSAGTSPLHVVFDASASTSPNGTIVTYAWDFGDGVTRMGMAAGHTYITETESAYVVTLTVTDNTGAQAMVSAEVTVSPPDAPSETVQVGFTWPFHFDATGEDALNLNDEYFTLLNDGTTAVDLSGWRVETEDGKQYWFPSGYVLQPGAVVTIHSGAGTNSQGILYWGSTEPVWNNVSGLAVLRDDAGTIVAIYPYFTCQEDSTRRS